jgi:SnoaL-like domain
MIVQSTTATVHGVPGPISNAGLPKWVVRQAFKTFETGNVADVDTCCHADYRHDEAPERAGPEGFRAMASAMRGAFSSLSYEEQRIVCQGDTLGSGAGRQANRAPGGPRRPQVARQLGVIPIYGDLAEGRTIGISSCALFEAVARGAQLEVFVQPPGSSCL